MDIYVTGEIVGAPVTGPIECKYFNRKVDVSVVDGFIGFLEDIGAKLGIIITNNGFTPAAKNRAAAKDTKIDIAGFVDIDQYEVDWNSCNACLSLGNGHYEVYWHHGGLFEVKHAGKSYKIEVGNCSYCNASHIKCNKCAGVFAVDDKYDKPIECYCGTEWMAHRSYTASGTEEETFYVKIKKRDIPHTYTSKMRGDL